MTIYVFTGPTLAAAEGRLHLDATYLPPAAQGDVYRVARTRPAAIGIIDGYFDTLPAIWHKEILWAMHEGVAVFGSASMGALRGAELAAFGMRGVGAIFEAFRSGELEDDDEVALAHEPESSGYRALSTPMVNVRATLAAAVEARVISAETRDRLVARTKELFYPERSYRRMIAEGNAAGLRAEMDALAAWLPQGEIDAKRADARAMLAAMKAHVEGPRDEARPRFHFEPTTFWEGLRTSADDATVSAPTGAPTTSPRWRDLLDEVRLQSNDYGPVRSRALSRALARALGDREGQRIPDDRLARAAEDFRRRRGLLAAGSLEAWLASHDLDEAALGRWLEDDALLRWALPAADADRRIAEELKLEDAYPDWRDRAADKRDVLAKAGLAEPGPADAGMTRDEIVDWYYREVAGRAPPPDFGRAIADAGFSDEQVFLRAALRELLYRRRKTAPLR